MSEQDKLSQGCIKEENKQEKANIKYLLFFILLFSIVCFVFLSAVLAISYNSVCSNELNHYIFVLLKKVFVNCYVFLTDFSTILHNIIKDFSWAFLVLVVFFCAGSMEKINFLVGKLGEVAANYGKAIHPSIHLEEQSTEDKKELKKEENIILQEEVKGKKTILEEKTAIKNTLVDFIENYIENHFDDYKQNSKLVINNDPVVGSISLPFNCSYKCNRKRYINTLYVIDSSSSFNNDRIYKYVRIMNDFNSTRAHRLYAMELIILTLNNDGEETGLFERLCETYEPAINNGVLAVSQYKIVDSRPEMSNKAGWVLNV